MSTGGMGEAGEAGAAMQDEAGSTGSFGGAKGHVIDGGSFSVAGRINLSVGGVGGVGGAGGVGGSAGLGASSGGDAAGAAGADDPARLCALATLDGHDPSDQSALIASSYWQILVTECRYAGLNCGVDPNTQALLLNTLRQYGPQLWHCDGLVAHDFRLVYQGRTVTQFDGEALIDLYVTLTMRKLLLSDSDAGGLRKQLLALMATSTALLADSSSISLCSGASCPSSGPAGGAGNNDTRGASGALGGSMNQGGAN